MRLGLELRLAPRGEARLEIALCGGATDSLFPRVEELLLSDVDAQAALFFATGKKKIDGYESLMDFVFCETFPEHRGLCRKYYDGKAPPLRDLLTGLPEWRFCDDVMFAAVGLAKACHRRGHPVSWSWFVATVKKAVRAHGG